ncbi:predicted protein [Nematostella vectensis]|uniref:CAP-Gly domain-containing protein n=1 Tax=Nematostella vectensis TaxID=45351 RepID=A7RHP8_NEMVE|nr:predicted protein [Nematostella vectensis]|eukprot:XP_001640953.1 predicted protein [Nematostella vectensis]
MADSHSNSSTGSSNNSGSTSQSAEKGKAARTSKGSSTQSRNSESASSLWPPKWLSGFDGPRSELYDSVDDDRELAAKAVAIVVNSTRKGVVSLCAEVASLLKAKKRLELALAAYRKGGLSLHIASSGSNGHRMSSSTGSGTSLSSKEKNTTQSKPCRKSLVYNSTNTEITPSSLKNASVQTDEDYKALLAEANRRNAELELELYTARAELKALKEKYVLPQLTNLKGQNRITNPLNTVNSKTKIIKAKSGQMETLNHESEFPQIPNGSDNLQGRVHDMTCNLKSCIKHRNKGVCRPFSTPFKVYPTSVRESTVLPNTASFYKGQCFLLPQSDPPSETAQSNDKELHSKAEAFKVIPSLGDYVVVQGEIKGIIKYLGPIKGELSSYAGVHLDSPVGNNDGTLNGVRYFFCPQNYGAFVLLEDIMSHQTTKSRQCRSCNSSPPVERNKIEVCSNLEFAFAVAFCEWWSRDCRCFCRCVML